jgi:hypothetical protein
LDLKGKPCWVKDAALKFVTFASAAREESNALGQEASEPAKPAKRKSELA